MSRERNELARAGAELSHAVAQAGQPQVVLDTFERLIRDAIGHRLFAVLAWRPISGDVERLYTSRQAEYPLLGRKRMGPAPWGGHALEGGRPWFDQDSNAIRWAFPDSYLTLSLGCESSQ